MIGKTRKNQAGYTMVELLVALTLGVFLTGSVISLFVGSKRTYNHNERMALLQENGRTALFVLAHELRHANFWGQVVNPGNIASPSASLTAVDSSLDTCAAWASTMTNTFIGSNTPTTHSILSCMGSTEIKTNTSAFAIKRVGNNPISFTSIPADSFFLRGHSTTGRILKKTTSVTAPASSESDWEYRPSLYYVRPYAETAGDGIPSLCVIQGNPTVTTETLIEGVEDLHIEYGVDQDGNGVPDIYTASPATADMADVVSTKLYLLIRDTTPDPNYNHNASYQLGNKTTGTLVDNFHRAVFSTTVVPHNQRSQFVW